MSLKLRMITDLMAPVQMHSLRPHANAQSYATSRAEGRALRGMLVTCALEGRAHLRAQQLHQGDQAVLRPHKEGRQGVQQLGVALRRVRNLKLLLELGVHQVRLSSVLHPCTCQVSPCRPGQLHADVQWDNLQRLRDKLHASYCPQASHIEDR